MKKNPGRLLPVVLMLAGCSTPHGPMFERTAGVQLQGTSDRAPATATVHLSSTPGAAATPRSGPTPKSTVPTGTTPPPVPAPTAQVQYRCPVPGPRLVVTTEAAQGLVFTGSQAGRKGIVILGKTGFQTPDNFLTGPSGQVMLPLVSPDGQWIANWSLDRPGDTGTLAASVLNPRTGQKLTATFHNVTLSRSDRTDWVNERQIVVPLVREGEQFRWALWSPFEDEQETLAVELTGIGRAMERFYVPPVLDPQLELVIYPCEECGGAEYEVKSLKSGESVWSVDFRKDPVSFLGIPAWSPDGEFVALVGGEDLNLLWVLNRQGQAVYEMALPEADGVWAAQVLRWSPGGRYLAFYRASPGRKITLAYLNLDNGSVVDLCVKPAVWVWSPDSTRIAVYTQIQPPEEPRLLTIVNLVSGDVVQLYDTEARGGPFGWMKPVGP